MHDDADRRAARSLGRAGRDPDGVFGAGAADRRGSGHLSDRVRNAQGARLARRARVSPSSACRSCTCCSRTGPTCTGRGSRVLEYMNGLRQRLPKRRRAHPRPRRHRGRLGVRVRACRAIRSTSRSCGALQDWYVRYQLTAVPGVSGGREPGRLRQAVPGRGRSRKAARVPDSGDARGGSHRQSQCRHGRARHRDGRPRVHDPWPRLSPVDVRHRGRGGRQPRWTGRPSGWGMSPRCRWARRRAAARPT